ncbi:MAG: sugar phosphate nucleotidyltransferase [Candidatus Hydrothermarchaeaceae archaeon]
MRGIILAAGKGTRLLPLTKYIAKALLPINGRPAIEQVVELFRDCGVLEIAIAIRHLGEQIKAQLGDGSEFDVRISYMEQGTLKGTAKAVEATEGFISEDVLVASSDCILSHEHVKRLLEYHSSERCDATLSLKALSREAILSSATVSMEEDGSISRIIEKPSKNEIISDIASSPYYVFKDVILEYLPRVKPSKRNEYELADVIQMMIDDGLNVKGLVCDDWKHLSDLKDLIRLNSDLEEARD